MAKKFDGIENEVTGLKKAQGRQGRAEHKTVSEAEKQTRQAEMRTQGKKGAGAQRINMAFTPDNIDFIRIMSRIRGQSMTEFTNYVLEQYRAEHPDVYQRAWDVINDS